MMPGNGIGPEMMGYVKDVFRVAGAPIDFETVNLDPTTDNYDDLYNVSKKTQCSAKSHFVSEIKAHSFRR